MNALYLAAVKTVNGDPPAPEIVDVMPEPSEDAPEATEDPVTTLTDW
jgi:hypothetical protein